jgi:hypothetical protein
MVEVHRSLWVGSQSDYEHVVSGQEGWAVVQACKFPYHRLAVGYPGAVAPENHPEHLFAYRENRLILNMIDAPDPAHFTVEMIEEALNFIDEAMNRGLKILVHCGQGESRSPMITMLHMAARLRVLPTDSFEEAERIFSKLYPLYKPTRGIREHLRSHWEHYCMLK